VLWPLQWTVVKVRPAILAFVAVIDISYQVPPQSGAGVFYIKDNLLLFTLSIDFCFFAVRTNTYQT
jgi:hypothetical protein